MITQEQLARWRGLADAATPGPWEQITEFGEWWISGPDIERHFVIGTTNGVNAQNVDFIAAAREAVPALLAEVERLQAAWSVEHDAAVRLEEQLKMARAELAQAQQQLQRAGLYYTPPDFAATIGNPPFAE